VGADAQGSRATGPFSGGPQVLLIVFATYPSLGLGPAISDSALSPLFIERAPILLRILPAEFDAAKQLS